MVAGKTSLLRIQSVRPHRALRSFVQSFVQRDAALGPVEIVEPVIARLGVTIEFKFAGLYQIRTYVRDIVVRPNRISIVGPQAFRRVRLTLTENIDSLTVIFQPCGFHALFGIPTHLLADTSTEGQAVLGKAAWRLYSRLGELRTFSERVNLLNSYFLQRTLRIGEIFPVYGALHQLAVNRHFTVSDAASDAGLSRRQLERKSLLYAGIAPKTLARIARFSSALQLSRETSLNWAEIAHAAEYHDHTHLIRDFRAFAGMAPSWARQEIAPDHLINFSGSYSGALYPET